MPSGAPGVFGLPVLAAAPVTVRHIARGTGAGAVTVLGASFIAQRKKGVNGRRGFQSGSYEVMLSDEGTATLTFSNTVGDDGVLHRRRFAILTDDAYHPGDEWIEILQDGRVLFTGTPVDRTLTRTTLTLDLADALWMANTQRETAAGFWSHAPRDVFEHYTKAWVPVVADDFDNGADTAKWTTANITNSTGSVRLNPVSVTNPAHITAKSTYWGTLDLATQRAWRLECTYDRALTVDGVVVLAMVNFATRAPYVRLIVSPAYITMDIDVDSGAVDRQSVASTLQATKSGASLAIECRDRFVFFYVDGALVFSCELDTNNSSPAVAMVEAATANTTTTTTANVRSVLLRRATPYLLRGTDKGDYRLPGLLPSGGLKGTYYDDGDLRSVGFPTSAYYRRALSPTRKPYARQQDATINFPSATPPTWMPATPPNGEFFSVQWTGAIYLDLAAADVTLRLTQLDHAARLWVGKTMYGEQLLQQWVLPTGQPFTLTSGSLRTHLGGSVSGWYPIRVDFAQGFGAAGIVFERSVGGAAYEVVPSTALSPFGIYEAQVRYDSHAEQLKAVALAFGLQYRCEPRTLESGQFPGNVVPRVRVGRDTNKILTPAESTEVSVKGSANEVIDTLYADAAGLADQANAVQLTAESVNFAALTPGTRMMILSAYESLADITDPVLLQTRIASMLGLRVTPWEEISARPRGHRELRDTFPMTGAIAAFAWEPGDGLRVVDDALDLRDLTPRQITGMTWPFVPDGLGAPSARFRQRPRTQQDAMRALVRATLLPQRNYQGQLVVVNGGRGAIPASGSADIYSRVSLPLDRGTVVSAFLVVQYKSDASVGTVQINGVAKDVTFSTVGRYDIAAYVAASDGGASPRMFATVTGTTGLTEFALELVTRI